MKRFFTLTLAILAVLTLSQCDFFSGILQGKKSISPAENNSINLSGTYNVTGTNPGGRGNYTGTASISPQGNQYKMHWEVGNSYDGIGTVEGNIFKVDWGQGTNMRGVVTYTIGSNGVLQGTWYLFDNPKSLGTETLTPQ